MFARATYLGVVPALLLAAAATYGLTPHVGLFHDDGIYVAGGQHLAATGEYTVASVPGSPPQTKYPPAYAMILALVWAVWPDFPGNVFALKAPNVIAYFIALLGTYALAVAAIRDRSGLPASGAVLIVGTSPALVSFVDYAMTDVVFTALMVCVMAAWSANAHRSPGRLDAVVLVLTAVAILTRSIGIAISLGLALECGLRREFKRALLHILVGAATFGAWLGWAMLHRSDVSPLVEYYVQYERSAAAHFLANPVLAWQIVSGNLRMSAAALDLGLSPALDIVWPLVVIPMIWGAWRVREARARAIVTIAGSYLAFALLHPFSPHRYLLPLFPGLVVLGFLGAGHIRFRAGSGYTAWTIALLVLLGSSNIVWLTTRWLPQRDTVKAWYGFDLGYRWDGFAETFEWIRANTEPDAKIGTIFDPMYFLYTGRQAVRPWLHRPETYFYPLGRATPSVGSPPEVAELLAQLDVSYIVLDPDAGYAEGPAATALLREIIRLPSVRSELVFVSSDREHLVYRMHW